VFMVSGEMWRGLQKSQDSYRYGIKAVGGSAWGNRGMESAVEQYWFRLEKSSLSRKCVNRIFMSSGMQ
jgi:hypothetical protein